MAAEVRLPRPLTVQLRGPDDLSFLEVAEAFWDQYGPDLLDCCQPWGQGRYQITFKSRVGLSLVEERGILLRNTRLFVDTLEVSPSWVTIRNAPFEMPFSQLKTALKPFGEILLQEYEYPIPRVKVTNGTRRVKMRMRRPVPNILRVGLYTLQCTYAGVIRLCRRCHLEGHMARDCSTPFCSGCREWGHGATSCPGRSREEDFPRLPSPSTSSAPPPETCPVVHAVSPASSSAHHLPADITAVDAVVSSPWQPPPNVPSEALSSPSLDPLLKDPPCGHKPLADLSSSAAPSREPLPAVSLGCAADCLSDAERRLIIDLCNTDWTMSTSSDSSDGPDGVHPGQPRLKRSKARHKRGHRMASPDTSP